MKTFENNQVENWIQENHAAVTAEDKMVDDVRLFANEWEIVEQEKMAAEDDLHNPVYAGQSDRIKRLKKKKIWKFIAPLYRLYANVKVRIILICKTSKKEVIGSIVRKVKNKLLSKIMIKRRNKRFIAKITLSKEQLEEQRNTKFSKDVKFSIMVPLYNTPEQFLRDMIGSVQAQTYGNWELCLADGSDAEHAEVGRICGEYAAKDSRIVYRKLEKNEGISENTNECIRMSTGNYIALFDHDDMLHPAALFRCMQEIEKNDAEFIYTDEMTFEKDSIQNIVTLHFKPAFSPQNLNGVNYICHLSVFKKSLLEKTGLYDNHYDGSQDHDMILKLTTVAKHVSHIPEVLYFWRVHPQSVSMNINAKTYAIDAGRNAVKDNEARLGRKTEVFSSCICATHYRLEYELQENPLVSILVVNNGSGKGLARLVDSIVKRTEYDNYEICIADFGKSSRETQQFLALAEQEPFIQVRRFEEDVTPAAACNQMAESVRGEYLVFLEADMEILDSRWLNRLLMYTMQDDIAVTGSRIIDPGKFIQEAGYIIGIGADGIAHPVEYGNTFSAPGYIGRMYYAHNVSAVSMWGMMVEKKAFLENGGFNNKLQGVYYLGIDYSLRQRKAGKQVVLEPYIINETHELRLTKLDENRVREKDAQEMKAMWGSVLAQGDPYYNKNFAKDGSFTYDMNS